MCVEHNSRRTVGQRSPCDPGAVTVGPAPRAVPTGLRVLAVAAVALLAVLAVLLVPWTPAPRTVDPAAGLHEVATRQLDRPTSHPVG